MGMEEGGTHGTPPRDPGNGSDADETVDGTRMASAADADIAITFKLYATLQDLLPAGTRRNATPIRVAVDASLNEIIDRFKVPRELAHLVLVNGHFRCVADRDARGALQEGDVLAIWPPVAGG